MILRSSRILAATTLVALSLSATAATTASAVGTPGSPTPTGTSTTTAPAASPTSAPTTASPTAAPSTRPTGVPAPTPTSSDRCHGGVYQSSLLKTTGTGLYNTTLIKGGPATDLTVTFENNSGIDLSTVHNSLYFVDEFGGERPVAWSPDFFDIQMKTPSGWKQLTDKDHVLPLEPFKLAKGEKLTVQFRIAATAKAPAGKYGGNYDGGSEAFDNDKVPTPANNKPNSCTQFYGEYYGEFQVAEPGGTTTPAASASPSAGPHLAETGTSSSTLPIALGGAAVLAAGAGTLLFLRRRKAHTAN